MKNHSDDNNDYQHRRPRKIFRNSMEHFSRNPLLLLLLLLVCGELGPDVARARPQPEKVSELSTRIGSMIGSKVISANNNGIPSEDEDLQLVQIIFRHGDRTPLSLYATDPYNNYSWPEGLGQLLERGKARMYNVGVQLRHRYARYLENILVRDVRAQSSSKRRCIESNLAVLAGLFPPRRNWLNGTTANDIGQVWQPIAVESTEPARSWLLNPDIECAAAQSIADRLPHDDPRLTKLLAENREFIRRLSAETGQNFTEWNQVGWIYDNLIIESQYFGSRFVRPAWLATLGNDTLDRLISFNYMQFSVYEPYKRYVRLRTGSLLRELIDNMRNVPLASSSSSSAKIRRLFTYGTHDSMVALVLQALGLYHDPPPSYGSGILVELRRSKARKNGEGEQELQQQHGSETSFVPMVHLFYMNTTDNSDIGNFSIHSIQPLELNRSPRFKTHCAEIACPLDRFERALADYLLDRTADFEKECAEKEPK